MKVLYVEDYAIQAQLVRDSLRRQAPEIELDTVPTVAQALQRLLAFEDALAGSPAQPAAGPAYDAVLADLSLPDGSGLDVLQHVRQRALPLAVVVLTGSGNEDSVFAALQAGADDYVLKQGPYLNALPRTLKAALEHFQAEAQRHNHTLHVLYAQPDRELADEAVAGLARLAPHMRIDRVSDVDDVPSRFAPSNPAPVPDVLLVDYSQPGLPALQTAKVLHQTFGLDVPVVLLTTPATRAVSALSARLGIADCLVRDNGYLDRLPASLDGAYRRAASAREFRSMLDAWREFHSLADNLPDVVLRFGLQRTVRYANRAALAMAGLAGDQLAGRRLADAGVDAAAAAVLDAALQAVLQTGADQNAEFALTVPGQGWRHFELHCLAERGASGKLASVLAIARDITERKLIEREREDHCRRLEDLVASRTAAAG